MAEATKQAVSNPYRPEKEKIVDFAPERLRAPFFLRCAAMAIDYMILIIFPVAWLLISKMVSESASGISIAGITWIVGIFLTLLNLVVLPLWRGQTVGKMVTGLTILKMDGTRAGIPALLLRNIHGYVITVLTFGLGFFIAAVNKSGRALHDLIAGTIVVRARKSRLL
ncbi:RDD family protein [soil metagenome]